jgi:sugar lactone lactonase YvrE
MKTATTLFAFAFLLSVVVPAASPDSPTITTVAGNGTEGLSGDGGPAASARIFNAHGIAFDALGNLYIADTDNWRIRKVDISGIITTVAGKGTEGFGGDGGAALSAELYPWGVALDPSGNLYIADGGNYRVRKVSTSGTIATVAGRGTRGFSGDGGPAPSAELGFTGGVALDSAGNTYIADAENNRLRRVSTSGIISTVAGNGTKGSAGDGGPATSAELGSPSCVAVDSAGDVYFVDEQNQRIRKVYQAGKKD